MPASLQSHCPLPGPFCPLQAAAQLPSCPQPPPQDRWGCLQNTSRIRKMMSLGEDQAPLPLLLEIPSFPQENTRNKSFSVVFAAPRNALRTGVMLQISVMEKKRVRSSAPDEPSTTGQIFPGSAHVPTPRRSSH